MPKNELYEKWRQLQYYVVIGIVSLVALFFLPMIGSEAGLAWNIPNTTAGWIVYITSKLLVATINILIYHCFILQAKINIQDDPKYKEATEILNNILDSDTERFRSPREYFKSAYGTKGVTIFITSVLSAIGLTQAVLTFDWISMLTYLFTIIMGLIFGVLQMSQTEIYWTTEYWQYAKRIEQVEAERKAAEALEVLKKEVPEQADDSSGDIGGTDILEPLDVPSPTCVSSES